ncbi:class D beta-lactamase [Campylobacter sp. TTU-622]|uniref:class D beta-lactamase n=1 Tax=Campylobacter sp. TTU-622 TaxID=2800583 RepID=UPI001904E3C3|nr:class D beta-lactamase [Campylobacter sp. TTU-622]MBK1972752.1 class D beta-lactamase [Campylobacter sp. TTU-622]
MRKIWLMFLFIIFLKAENLPDFFKEQNTSGVFIIYDGKNFLSNDFKRANKAFSPASTFKIFNALIALNLKIVKNTEEIFYHYKGEKVFLKSWANDANLSSAMKRSQVTAFKELARKIGIKRMQENLNLLNYGNKKISKIDNFWLDNSLKISAKEQAVLLFKLANLKLAYPKAIQEELINIIKLKENDNFILYGKTGFNDKQNIAWKVGFIKTKKQIYSFALNVDIKDFKDLKIREELLEKYLAIISN